MVRLHVGRAIAAFPQRVFDWLADPVNLTADCAKALEGRGGLSG